MKINELVLGNYQQINKASVCVRSNLMTYGWQYCAFKITAINIIKWPAYPTILKSCTNIDFRYPIRIMGTLIGT
jgi:hypothetical protein